MKYFSRKHFFLAGATTAMLMAVTMLAPQKVGASVLTKLSKKALLYASIGLFVMGGLVLGEVKTAHASFPTGTQEVYPTLTVGTYNNSGYYYTGPVVTWTGSSVIPPSAGWAGSWNGPFQYGGCTADYPSSGNLFAFRGTSLTNCTNVYINGQSAGLDSGSLYPTFPIVNQYTANGQYYFIALGNDGVYYWFTFYWDGANVTPDSSPVTDTNTRIMSVVPVNGTTTATTTALGEDVYVNANDLASSTQVSTRYTNANCSANSGAVIDAVSNTIGQGCSFTLSYPVTASGETDISTTTTFVYGGTWQYVTTISNTTGTYCLFGFCLSSSQTDLAQVSGSFVVGGLNALDVIQQFIASSSAALGSLATTTQAISNVCNPFYFTSFSIGSCMWLLVIPTGTTTSAFITGVSGQFLTYVPLGYVTRFISILTSGTTTPLPNFVYTPPAILGYSQGAIVLNPWNLFSTSSFIGSLTSSSSTGSRTLRSIAEPYWDFLWTLVLLGAIIGRITGIYPHIGSPAQDSYVKGKHGMKHVPDETYRYKEKLYDMSKRK